MMILQTSRANLSSGDQCSLDLPFAATKSLTARIGPTPVFTRASTATYFGPSGINVAFSFDGNDYDEAVFQNTVFNGRFRWTSGDISLSYTGTAWSLAHDGNSVATSAPTTAYRPDLANWSGTGVTVAATSTFGIVRSASGEPRFDHNPLTLACKGLLIEEPRTNYILQSENFSSYWIAGAGVVSRNKETTIPDPAGTFKGTRVEINAAFNIYRDPIAAVPDGTRAVSIFARAVVGGLNLIRLAGTSANVTINLATGATIINSGTVAGSLKVERFGDIGADGFNWWRISYATTKTTSASLYIENGGTVSGAITAFLIWGAQYELGAFPTSYIPTVASSVVRSADVCDVIGADVHPSVGTLVVEFDRRSINSALFRSPGRVFASASAISADYAGIDHNDTQVRTPIKAANATVSTLAFNNTSIGTTKTAVAWSSGDSSHVSGGVVRISTSAAIAFANPLDTINFCGIPPSAICTTISSIRYYKKRLPNAKLQALTV